MAIKIGINGFGRIGRSILRALLAKQSNVELVLINELGDLKTNAHLLQYDSVHGKLPVTVSADETPNEHGLPSLKVGDQSISMSSIKNPAEIPWGQLGVDIVMECTGIFTARDQADLHLQGGAKKVLISAPAPDPDITTAFGINFDQYDPANHHIISNASCTTNCLSPVAKVLHEVFGIENGLMTTVHSYTNDQRILDVYHKDLRRARAGAVSQIPTKTGAAAAVGLVLPELKGKIDGMAIRVPTPNVSCVDFVCNVAKPVSVESVNEALKQAANTSLKGVLDVSDEPLVSIDYNGNPHSSIVDSLSTKVIGQMVKVLSWYDNESGFSHRMVDVAAAIGEKI